MTGEERMKTLGQAARDAFSRSGGCWESVAQAILDQIVDHMKRKPETFEGKVEQRYGKPINELRGPWPFKGKYYVVAADELRKANHQEVFLRPNLGGVPYAVLYTLLRASQSEYLILRKADEKVYREDPKGSYLYEEETGEMYSEETGEMYDEEPVGINTKRYSLVEDKPPHRQERSSGKELEQ